MPNPASMEDLLRIARAQQLQQIDIARRTANTIDAAWTAFGGLDDAAMAAFVDAALPIMATSIDATIALTDAHLAQYLTAATGETFTPLGITSDDVTYRAGADIAKVYERPTMAARRAINGGQNFQQAMQMARGRARQTADTDVMQTARQTAIRAMATIPRVQGYRRLTDGNACQYCQIASTQRYHQETLMPVHSACHCTTVPIVGTKDPGRILDREAQAKLKASGAIDQKNYERRIADNERIVQGYRDRSAHWREEARTTPSMAAESRYAHRADTWKALADDKELELVNDRRILAEIKARRAGDKSAIAVHDHGELGPVLAPSGNKFGEGELPPPAPAPPVRRTKATVLDPDVLAEASRKKITPERVIEQREERAERRYLEQRARREAEKAISVDSADVIAAAKRHGVTPDEVLTARARVGDLRAAVRNEAAKTSADALRELEQLDALHLKPPALKGAKTAGGRAARGGEYDFLERTSDRERARLSREWYGGNQAPDQWVDAFSNFYGRDMSVDDTMAKWMELNRRAEAAGALRRGKLPSLDAYSGQIDVDDLVPHLRDQGYKLEHLLGDDLDAAAHIAHVDRALTHDDAIGYLGDAYDAKLGPKPYRMGYQSWENEVRELEDRISAGTATAHDIARHREIVPEYLDDPALSFEELHAKILDAAHAAGETVSTEIQWIDDYAGLDPSLFKTKTRILPKPEPPKVAVSGELRPPPGRPPPSSSITYASPKAEAKFGSTVARLDKLIAAPVDDLAPLELVLGRQTGRKGGHFGVERRASPVPRQKPRKGKTRDQIIADRHDYNARVTAYNAEIPRPEIVVLSKGKGEEDLFVFLHEYGHRIDVRPVFRTDAPTRISRTTDRSKDTRRNRRPDSYNPLKPGETPPHPTWQGFHDAVRDSPTIADAHKYYKDFDFQDYFRSDEEMWARAFSQWTANKLGGPELDSFQTFRASDPHYQWTDEEFELIAPHIEAILREEGFIE